MKRSRGQHKRGYKSYSQRPRDHSTRQVSEEDASPLQRQFLVWQNELDARHDKHERIFKLSRDVTIESKRTIFTLQRVVGTSSENRAHILSEVGERLTQLRLAKWRDISIELRGEDPYRFLRAYLPGLQEYIEAQALYDYLRNDRFTTLAELQELLTFEDPKVQPAETEAAEECDAPDTPVKSDVTVPSAEYMLGLSDVTGELMRMAISSVGAEDERTPFLLCELLRQFQDAMTSCNHMPRELLRKLTTLRQSLRKVEKACYTMQVRGSEVPRHMLVDFITYTDRDGHRDDCDDVEMDT